MYRKNLSYRAIEINPNIFPSPVMEITRQRSAGICHPSPLVLARIIQKVPFSRKDTVAIELSRFWAEIGCAATLYSLI